MGRRRKALPAVSLFSNCGAGDIGYVKAGFRFEVLAELDERRLSVALLNHTNAIGVPGDLRATWPEVVRKYRSRNKAAPALLAACPPCQGMSSARSGRGRADDPDAGSKDERNLLVVVIAKVAQALEPRTIVVENVEQFLTRKVRHPQTGKAVSAAALLIARLKDDYVVFPFLSDLADYGVPQHRKRAFLTFIRKSEAGLRTLIESERVPYPVPTHTGRDGTSAPVTLREALAELGARSLDAISKVRAGRGMHSVPVWPDKRYPMVAAIPPDSGRSAWENSRCEVCGDMDVGRDAATCPVCKAPLLRPVVKARNGRYRLVNGFRSSSYRRMLPDEPASTVTTASGHIGSDSTIHPSENRLLSPLECAHLQTIPRSFRWGTSLRDWGATNVREMIGEAVPPRFTWLHGRTIFALLTHAQSPLAWRMDRRCMSGRWKVGMEKRWYGKAPVEPEESAA